MWSISSTSCSAIADTACEYAKTEPKAVDGLDLGRSTTWSRFTRGVDDRSVLDYTDLSLYTSRDVWG